MNKKSVNGEDISKSVIPLSAGTLLQGLRIPFEVFIKKDDSLVPLFTRWTLFDERTSNILKDQGIDTIYIESTEENLSKYLTKSTTEKPEQPSPDLYTEYARKLDSHHQIDKNFVVDELFLIPNTYLNFSIYSLHNMEFSMVLEASEKSPAKIPAKGLKINGDVTIKFKDIPLYQNYLNQMINSASSDDERTRKRAFFIKEQTKIITRELLLDPGNINKVDELAGCISDIINFLKKSGTGFHHLMTSKTQDLYTYTHSTNVSVISIALGIASGMEDSKLEKLGIGTMLHDIGRPSIPPEIQSKPSYLTNDEFAKYKLHVAHGLKMLQHNRNMPNESLVPVVQHHEKLSGRGYPAGLSGKHVKPFGRIASMVDTYDCLTTLRPFRYAFTPYIALSIIAQETRDFHDYDPELLKLLIGILS
ncbi:MAG: HD domain-containing phosphohydrolase [Dissulfurispiraceae bacterium]|jgi:HD-GYP domain-containing protein (c-di-GMP phosphodiesterase class II)|nr:HD domain-containing phosphohydrolase [Dissulfurispiraceae bacterium]